jgi:hypothetical protein
MILTTPISFTQALKRHDTRVLFPTRMKTSELQQLGAEVLRESLFSAQVLYTSHLEQLGDVVRRTLDPIRTARANGTLVTEGINLAKSKEIMKDSLQALGYLPSADERGTILDLSSDARIELQVNTLVQTAQGEGWWLQGQEEAVLDEFPSQELFRAEARKQERNWLARFRLAGERTGDPIGTGWTITPHGRMIALKNHKIWEYLGDPSLFKDGLGNPWPPFAFESGMNVRDVDRAETESIGLIQPGQSVKPMTLADLKEAA